MSKPSRLGDVERTAIMKDLLRQTCPGGGMSLSQVMLEEVAPGTGWSAAQRWADVLIFGMWPSKGTDLDGYEVKASRADLKRELAHLDKHRAVARYCDHWWLLAWDESVLLPGIPEDWGVMVTVDDDDAGRDLKVLKEAPKREPEPWPRAFVCSLVRNAYEQSPGAAYVGRAAVEAYQRGRRDGKSSSQGEVSAALDPLCAVLYGEKRWNWPSGAHDLENVVKAVIDRLDQGVLGSGAPGQEGR